jgi:hypothetical protein
MEFHHYGFDESKRACKFVARLLSFWRSRLHTNRRPKSSNRSSAPAQHNAKTFLAAAYIGKRRLGSSHDLAWIGAVQNIIPPLEHTALRGADILEPAPQ